MAHPITIDEGDWIIVQKHHKGVWRVHKIKVGESCHTFFGTRDEAVAYCKANPVPEDEVWLSEALDLAAEYEAEDNADELDFMPRSLLALARAYRKVVKT